jgi:DNA-binding NarL/FixJ family response regulator
LKFRAKIPALVDVVEWVVNLYPIEFAGAPHVCSLVFSTTTPTAVDAHVDVRSLDHGSLAPQSDRPNSRQRLADREMQVITLLAEGKSNKEIAAILRLSRRTVEFYRAQIFRKLDVHSVGELILYAVRERLVRIE